MLLHLCSIRDQNWEISLLDPPRRFFVLCNAVDSGPKRWCDCQSRPAQLLDGAWCPRTYSTISCNMYIYRNTCVHIYIYTYTYIETYEYMYIHTCIGTDIYIYIYMYIYTYIYLHTCIVIYWFLSCQYMTSKLWGPY